VPLDPGGRCILIVSEPVLKASLVSWHQSLNLKCVTLFSSFSFNCNLRHYTQEMYLLDHLVDPSNPVMGQLGESGEGVVGARSGRAVIALHAGQGLTLVHFSAQPEPFWSHLHVSPCLTDRGESCTQRIPQNVLTSSRKVEECEPLTRGRCTRCSSTTPAPSRGKAERVDSIKTRIESAPGFSA
jgi:hypothetical protein